MDSRKPITISLNPTYLCNFRCEFCYLTPEQLADQKKIEPERLERMLGDIVSSGYRIEHVDLYGGEVALLSESYLKKVDELLYVFDNPTINIITNLSKVHPYFLEEHVDLSVSYDFNVRERHEQVLTNMMKTPKDIAILMLASPELIEQDVEKMIKTFNALGNIISVEIKPYSSNQANVLKCTDKDFEEFVKKWLLSTVPKNFTFVNADRIRSSLDRSYSAFSDAHVYITPNGKFGVLEFDTQGNEFFMEMDSFNQYLEWAKAEKLKVNSNPICNSCPYLGTCLTEHYRDVKSLEHSCNGFRLLLDWSQANRYLIDN
jgi:sulfatase maturation enzyme AslB (radical SAM superfamily)